MRQPTVVLVLVIVIVCLGAADRFGLRVGDRVGSAAASLKFRPVAEDTLQWRGYFPPANGPGNLLRRLKWAYERRLTATYRDLFTADFRFHFADPELIRKYPQGWTRADEVLSADHLFHGFTNESGEEIPAARSILLFPPGHSVVL